MELRLVPLLGAISLVAIVTGCLDPGMTSVDVKIKDETNLKPDVYMELQKLNALRKQGILSEAEFEAQKKKLLNGYATQSQP